MNTRAKTLGIADYERLAEDFKLLKEDTLGGLRLRVVNQLPPNPEADVLYIIRENQ